MTRLYTDLSPWWPLMSAPHEYVEEAAFYLAALLEAARIPVRSLLELGSGGGNNAVHMKAHFEEVVLVDLSPGMLAHSRLLNPECAHVEGDMRDVRLGRQFDVVFVHDAIDYMATEADLRRAIVTAYEHCKPGGAVLFAPDCVAENFTPSTDCGGNDDGERGVRYLEWSWDPDPSDTQCTTDYVFAIREADGTVEVVHDRHIGGLFPRAVWVDLMVEAGFTVEVKPFDHSELEPGTYELFVCQKPAG
jgi:SAM-dependent methyltransferase